MAVLLWPAHDVRRLAGRPAATLARPAHPPVRHRARPDDEAGWLALAAHYRDTGRDDEAAAVRVFWPTMRGSLGGRSLEAVLADVERSAKILGATAREIEERAH